MQVVVILQYHGSDFGIMDLDGTGVKTNIIQNELEWGRKRANRS